MLQSARQGLQIPPTHLWLGGLNLGLAPQTQKSLKSTMRFFKNAEFRLTSLNASKHYPLTADKFSDKLRNFLPRCGGLKFGCVAYYHNIRPCLACHISASNRDIPVWFPAVDSQLVNLHMCQTAGGYDEKCPQQKRSNLPHRTYIGLSRA